MSSNPHSFREDGVPCEGRPFDSGMATQKDASPWHPRHPWYVICWAILLPLLLAACNAPEVRRDAEIYRFQDEIRTRTEALAIQPGQVLTMDRAAEIALQNNIDLAISKLTLRLQDENVRLALVGYLPKATASYTLLARSNAPLINQGGGEIEMEPRRQQLLSLNATMPVLDFGTIYYAYRIARDQRTQQELLFKRTQQQLRRDVRIAYAKYAGALRQEKLTVANIVAAEQVLKVAESFEREGLATGSETAIFRAAMAQVKVDHAVAVQKIAETRMALANLLSLPPSTEFRIDPNLPELPAPPTDQQLAAAEEHALQVRPELQVQDLQRHIAANTVRQQISSYLPRVDSIVAFNWTSNPFMVNPAYFLYGVQVATALLDPANIFKYRAAQKGLPIEEERTLTLSLGVMYDVDLRAIQLRRQRETITALDASEKARRDALNRIVTLYKEGLENEAGAAKALADLNVETVALDRAQVDYLATWYEYLAAVLPEEAVAATQGSAAGSKKN